MQGTDILMAKSGNKKAERALWPPTVTKEGDIIIKERTNHAKFEEREVLVTLSNYTLLPVIT